VFCPVNSRKGNIRTSVRLLLNIAFGGENIITGAAKIFAAIRMAVVAGVAIVLIAGDTLVFFVHFPLAMAGQTGEDGVIVGIGVTIRAHIPLPLVFPAVDGEIGLMVEGGIPVCGAVAVFAE